MFYGDAENEKRRLHVFANGVYLKIEIMNGQLLQALTCHI